MNKKALIAMSGGVDSSVSAFIMASQGYTCAGATMRLFNNETIGRDRSQTCCSLEDVEDARSVAYSLDMPFYVFNFMDKFEDEVIRRFICSYECCATPNPCIDCNRYLKFEKFLHRARELDFDYVVTGHYAQIVQDAQTGRYLLKKAADSNKDQSYVLYSMTQEQLAHTLFPLGGMTKPEVREIAQAHGFINAKKRDSQDICFVPDGDYARFIESFTGKTYPPGNFIDKSGNVLGQHKGLIRYTIGQRKGLGLALPRPMYVADKNEQDNTVTLVYDEELYSHALSANQINLIRYPSIPEPIRVKAKVRYKHTEQWATAVQTGEDMLSVVFDEPQRAISRGQAVVLYQDDIVVGGGTIL